MIGSARGRSVSPTLNSKPAKTEPTEMKKENTPAPLTSEDFPNAPKEEFKSAPTVEEAVHNLRNEDEPLIAT